jgi:hypothetical protein
VIGWPLIERFRELLGRGAVVVAYSGCDMQILENCRVQGHYEFFPEVEQYPGSAKIDKSLNDANQVWFRLPLGATHLERERPPLGWLRLRATQVGTLHLQSYRLELPPGGCPGATHLIDRVTVGHYELTAEEYEEKARLVRSAGAPKGCDAAAADNPSCRHPLYVHLEKLAPPGR